MSTPWYAGITLFLLGKSAVSWVNLWNLLFGLDPRPLILMARNCFALKRFREQYILSSCQFLPLESVCHAYFFVVSYIGVLFGVRCSNPHGAHAGISVLTNHLVAHAGISVLTKHLVMPSL